MSKIIIKGGDFVNKKVGLFFVGYMLSILIMYIIPVIMIYPNITNTMNLNSKQSNSNEEYKAAVDKINAANLSAELNIYNNATSASLKNQVNIRNYIMIFYAVMLFISLFAMGMLLMKKDDIKKFLGKGIICGIFVGAAGITATIIFSSSYFIL